MAGQTSVDFDPPIAIEGMVARCSDPDALSYVCEVAMDNGRLAVQGASDKKAKLPTLAAHVAKPLGITPYRATQMPNWPPGGSSAHYQIGDTVGPIRHGRVWVKVEEAVNAQDPVYVRFAANGGLTALGAFRKSADDPGGGATAALLAGAVYLTTAAINGFALVEINLP